jgi:hypothetical protein
MNNLTIKEQALRLVGRAQGNRLGCYPITDPFDLLIAAGMEWAARELVIG